MEGSAQRIKAVTQDFMDSFGIKACINIKIHRGRFLRIAINSAINLLNIL